MTTTRTHFTFRVAILPPRPPKPPPPRPPKPPPPPPAVPPMKYGDEREVLSCSLAIVEAFYCWVNGKSFSFADSQEIGCSCETRTSTCRNFATISSGLYRFLAITVLLDVKDIPSRITSVGADHSIYMMVLLFSAHSLARRT